MVRRYLTSFLVVGTAFLALVPGSATAQTVVGVDLTEAPPSVTPSVATVAAGSVTFEAENVGGIQHELVVIRTDLAADALPQSGDTVDVSGLDVLGDTDAIDSGASEALTVDLAAGNYVLICNVPGHYGLGMRTAFTVTAADAGSGSGSGSGAPAPSAAGNAGLSVDDVVSPLGALALAVVALGLVAGGRLATARRR